MARGLSPAQLANLGPRLGVAYSPSEKTSVRASYGRFYTGFQGLSAGIMYGVPPFGYNYQSPAPPLFATPFITAADGTNNGQRFPLAPVPLGASATNPVTIGQLCAVSPGQRRPVSGDRRQARLFRQLHGVGGARADAQHGGHGELRRRPAATTCWCCRESNPGNPALCLSVSQPSQVAPGSPTCGPFAENGVFTTASGQVINGTRTTLGPNYGSVTEQQSIGFSRYNALELNWNYTHGPANVRAGYTYSKSMDVSSNLGEQVNPFNVNATLAPSAYDLRHNFVISYGYELPFAQLVQHSSRLTTGWTLSGTTRFASGFPVTLYNPEDTSLLGTFGNGVNNYLLDTPNYTPGCPLNLNHRSGERAGVQHGVLQPAGGGSARQRTAPVLLRTWHREFRHGADQERAARRVQDVADPPRGVQRLQPSAVLRPIRGERKHCQPAVWPDSAGRRAQAHSARREVFVLDALVADGHFGDGAAWALQRSTSHSP